jgi:adenosyl cobinamide kinase/adenosyl cobinamide phosphate guanylyltransferase
VITLVLGGTRSGKSEVAETLVAGAPGPVTYVATGQVTDADMADRIAAHRRRRPAGWATVEAGTDLPAALAPLEGHVLVDSLGTWVAGHHDLAPDAAALCAALRSRAAGGSGDTVVVSEEVGLGVHPPTEVGRRFADTLGELNRAVADQADRVLLVVAGRVLPLERVTGPA